MALEKGIRLNKYLSDAGVCSRREADRLIEAGEVLVDGKRAVMGQQVLPGQTVVCGGKPVEERKRDIFLAVYKPRGIVCTTSDKDRAENIVEFLNYPERVYPVGRLDKDSEGLLLMTNQGDIVNKILRAGNHHEKEYAVAVSRPVSAEFLAKLREGVWLEELETTTKPWALYVPYYIDPGAEPPDPADVPRSGLPCGKVEAGSDHEHPAGGHETGRV